MFGRVEIKNKEALSRVSFWDDLEERELDLKEVEERARAREEFKNWAVLEEIYWRQKSRELWLKGDKNTGFFHRMANSHRRRNFLLNICIKRLEKEVEIKEGLIKAFQNLLSSSRGWCPPLLGLNYNEIGSEATAKLEEGFIEEEIWTTIQGLKGDKAFELDGFPLAFWSFSWEFVKEEVLGFLKEFYEHSRFVKSLNVTFLVLIPKKTNVEDLKDLRPISLVGSLQDSNKSVG